MSEQGDILQPELDAVGFRVTETQVLGSNVEADYYISRTGNAFAAEHLGDRVPPRPALRPLRRVPVRGDLQRRSEPDAHHQAAPGLRRRCDSQTWALTKQVDDYVMQNALDAPIAFVPQFMAYSTARVHGVVHAQTDICNPPDLTGITSVSG